MSSGMTSTHDKTSVYYDGSCPICRTEIAFMRGRDRNDRIDFVDIAERPDRLPAGIGPEEAMRRFHVREPDGTIRDGAAGFAAMWRELPGFRTLGRVVNRRGMLAVLDVAYAGFLKVRPLLQPVAKAFERRSA